MKLMVIVGSTKSLKLLTHLGQQGCETPLQRNKKIVEKR